MNPYQRQEAMSLPETIKLQDGRTVLTEDYIVAKTKDLQEYGYGTLTLHETRKQLDKILRGESLNVIGLMMDGDLAKT